MCKISKRLLWNIGQLRWETRGNGQLDVKQFRVFFMQCKGRISQSIHFRHAEAALYTFYCTEVVDHEMPAPAFCGQLPIARGHAFPVQCQCMMKSSMKQVVDGGGK